SVETALGLAGGLLIVELVDLEEDDPERVRRFSEKRACPNDHPLQLEEIEPRTFSFNAPYGACPDEEKSLAEGAVLPWAQIHSEYFTRVLSALAEELEFSMDTPWRALPERA